jgi:hypothetical protein
MFDDIFLNRPLVCGVTDNITKTARDPDNSFYCLMRARICKRLRSPGIDSEESIPPACYIACRAGTLNRFVVPVRQAGNRFWAPLYKFGLCSPKKKGSQKHNQGRRSSFDWKKRRHEESIERFIFDCSQI